MAKLIPNLNSCLSRMTNGEKRFARRLEQKLDEDYLCWYDLPLGLKRRYSDFIVLHPARGVLMLEVKDWKLENIESVNHQEMRLNIAGQSKSVSHPLEQVRQCMYQLVNCFQKDKQLIQPSGRYQGKLAFPYGYGVVFTNITRDKFYKACANDEYSNLFPQHLFIFQDEMFESVDEEDFQERLWGMFNNNFSSKLTLPQIDRIRWHLFPEIRLDHYQQADLFADDIVDSEQDKLAQVPDVIKIMDMQQEQLARSLGSGHRVIHGVAGSGKTLILGYRCQYLAELAKKPILVLCFNITLASNLKQFMASKGIDERVKVYHFHDWCGQQLKTYNVDILDNGREVWEAKVDSVIDGVEKGLIPRHQYDAVLIDEGHDFEAEWLTLITQMVDPEKDSLLLLYDDAQSIYKSKKNLDFSLSSVGIQAQGRTTILKLNYRNTREILEFAYQFARAHFEGVGSKAKEIPLIKPEKAGTNGEKPIYRSFASIDEEVSFICRCIKKWLDDGVQPNQIAIIYSTYKIGKTIANTLDELSIDNLFVCNSSTKKQYNNELSKIALLTRESSKGLEFDRVVVCGAGMVPDDEEAQMQQSRLFYVAMTRAKDKLLVTSSAKHNSYTERLEEICLST